MPPYNIDMAVLVEQLADTTNVNQNVLKKKDGAGIKTLVSNSTLRSYAYTHNYAVIYQYKNSMFVNLKHVN